MSDPKTYTLDVPGAVLTYDVRSNESSAEPVLLIVGSPMAASGFGTLAGHFGDRTVVTYDPRGSERSMRTDGASENTPDEHADDLHRLIAALDAGPVDIFGSSGGAVNALALVARHPEQVRTLVAHEPPASQEVPDHAQILAACQNIHETYLTSGFGPAMAKFIALIMHQGLVPDGFADEPVDPARFGLPAEDDGSRNDPLVGLNIVSCNAYHHDFGALRQVPTRIVIGVGAKSGQTLAARTGIAVAERLGITPTGFPGDHGGFLSREHIPTGEPDAFAATLRQVLAA
ncbi:MAG: alpha/beta hydrolase [Streptosporangiaceae bacterium]